LSYFPESPASLVAVSEGAVTKVDKVTRP
jgi:hypothetical protein